MLGVMAAPNMQIFMPWKQWNTSKCWVNFNLNFLVFDFRNSRKILVFYTWGINVQFFHICFFFPLPMCNRHHLVITFNAVGICSKTFAKLMATRLNSYTLTEASYVCEQKQYRKIQIICKDLTHWRIITVYNSSPTKAI